MKPESNQGAFGRDVLVTIGFMSLSYALAFGNSIVIARMIGTEGRGLYALAVSSLAVAGPLLLAGLNQTATWQIGRGGDPRTVITFNHLWAGLVLLLGGASAIAIIAAAGANPSSEAVAVALAISLIVPAFVYIELARGHLLGRGRVYSYNAAALVVTATLLILNFVLLSRGKRWVLFNLAGGYWLGMIVLAIGYARHAGRARLPDRPFLSATFGHGLSAGGWAVADGMLLRVDILVMAPVVTSSAVGLYGTADQFGALIGTAGVMAGRMMLAQSANDPEGVESRRKLGLASRLIIVFVFAAAVGFAAIGQWLLPFLFGADFAPAYVGVLLLCPSALFKGLGTMLATYLIGRGITSPALRAGVIAITVEIIGVYLAARAFGWHGAAVVKSFAFAVQFAILYFAYRRDGEGEPVRWLLNGEDARFLRRWVRSRLSR